MGGRAREVERAGEIARALGVAVEMSGGSAANTMCGVASLGGRAAYIGKVSDDELDTVAAPVAPTRDPRLSDRVEAALTRLPAGYRAILVLHDIEGLSHEECAAILDCRVGTCKSQLHKARGKMRELLGPALAAERGLVGSDALVAARDAEGRP